MQISDLVYFSKENYFNGAVQTEWYYDQEKLPQIAESYIFHGPKYYGVSKNDVSSKTHRLIDTASFTKKIAEKLHAEQSSNNFVMTIAGYGTGKSHLAVSLGALFGDDGRLRDLVTENIFKVDAETGSYIKQINQKKNLVIALNGMNNFNLDAEVLRCAVMALSQNGLSDDILKEVTKSYDLAKQFVSRSFWKNEKEFTAHAQEQGIYARGDMLKSKLLQNIEKDQSILEIVNQVYFEANGDTIRWERGLSAGDIITTLQKKLCGHGKPFNKVLILFDEFGRFIEYAAANPTIAGDAALQQIFEAVQGADGKIVFVGFIQSELDAYLSRIEKTANIIRYIGRYKNSEKLFLSSNFETILANLIKKKDTDTFIHTVGAATERYEGYFRRILESIKRWDRSSNRKSVWIDPEMFRKIILQGCYPLHPLTVWMLSNTSNWMQQRSTIAFASEMMDLVADENVTCHWLPFVYPYQIVESGIFNEMLNAEEKGLVNSQYCMLYQDILLKIGAKLSDNEKKVLQAVLVVNVARFVFYDKNDAILALQYCTNLKEEEVQRALKNLETMHGVVTFDDQTKTFDLLAEASGVNEFRRVFMRYRISVGNVLIDDCDENLRSELSLHEPVETSFGQEHSISSTEWRFEKVLIDASDVDENLLKSSLRRIDQASNGTDARGILYYVYCSEHAADQVKRISTFYQSLTVLKYSPIIMLFLDDNEGEILEMLAVQKALKKFSATDRERFSRFVSMNLKSTTTKICKRFNKCVIARNMINENGLVQYSGRVAQLCSRKFNEIFTSPVPFVFDGFENKSQAQGQKALATLCVKMLDQTLMNIQSYQGMLPKDKNRVKSCLATNSQNSWKVFNENCQLIEPENPVLAKIFREVESKLTEKEAKGYGALFSEYTKAPYGMNENAIALFMIYFVAQHGKSLYAYYSGEKLTAASLNSQIFKGSKLKISELCKITLQKNPNKDVDLVAQVCRKIINSVRVEDCYRLERELNSITVQEGVSPDNQYLEAQARHYIEVGQKLDKKLSDQLQKIYDILDECERDFDIRRLIKIFDYLILESGKIEEGYAYRYSDNYLQSMQTSARRADRLIRNQYPTALEKLTCKITELSLYNALYNNIAKKLRENGYPELAQITRRRMEQLEKEIISRQQFSSFISECEQNIALASQPGQLTYTKCVQFKETLNNQKKYIDRSKEFPEKDATVLIQSIQRVLNNLDSRIDAILGDYNKAMQSAYSAKSKSELKRANIALESMLSMGLSDECVSKISEAQQNIDDQIEALKEIPTELKDVNKMYSEVQNKNGDNWKAVLAELERTRDDLIRKEQVWIRQYLDPVQKSLQKMNVHDCMRWMDKTRVLPDYLSVETEQQFLKVEKIVEDKLHAEKVRGVVEMYKQLTDDEKKQFKKMILLDL